MRTSLWITILLLAATIVLADGGPIPMCNPNTGCVPKNPVPCPRGYVCT